MLTIPLVPDTRELFDSREKIDCLHLLPDDTHMTTTAKDAAACLAVRIALEPFMLALHLSPPENCNPCSATELRAVIIRIIRLQGFLEGLVASGQCRVNDLTAFYGKLTELYLFCGGKMLDDEKPSVMN